MSDGWLDGWERHPGHGSGTWAPDNEDAPKIVLHMTQGSTAEGAIGAFTTNDSWPHVTVDPRRNRRIQHLPFTEAARALRNTSTPGQTNREARVFQVEIVGMSEQAHNLTDTELAWLGREVVGPIARATGTPLRCTVRFHGLDAGFTLASVTARQRLSVAEWDTYAGVLGHQHVPENTHWDPGRIDIDRILAAAGSTSEEDDMTPDQARKLDEIHAALFAPKDGKGPVLERIVRALQVDANRMTRLLRRKG